MNTLSQHPSLVPEQVLRSGRFIGVAFLIGGGFITFAWAFLINLPDKYLAVCIFPLLFALLGLKHTLSPPKLLERRQDKLLVYAGSAFGNSVPYIEIPVENIYSAAISRVSHGDGNSWMIEFSLKAPMFVNSLAQRWMRMMPKVEDGDETTLRFPLSWPLGYVKGSTETLREMLPEAIVTS